MHKAFHLNVKYAGERIAAVRTAREAKSSKQLSAIILSRAAEDIARAERDAAHHTLTAIEQ